MEIVFGICLFGAIGVAAIYLVYKIGWGVYMVATGTKIEVVWSDSAVQVAVTIVCGLSVIWAIVAYHVSHPASTTANVAEERRNEASKAFTQCQYFVRSKLKSPSTATFPILDYESFPRGLHEYAVRSYVDSQNSYGAMIRANFFCQVRWNGQNWASIDNWELVQLEFQ